MTAPTDFSIFTLHYFFEFRIIILFLKNINIELSFIFNKVGGRSSSLVGYGIGIAEIVGSNPTRSTNNLLIKIINDLRYSKISCILSIGKEKLLEPN